MAKLIIMLFQFVIMEIPCQYCPYSPIWGGNDMLVTCWIGWKNCWWQLYVEEIYPVKNPRPFHCNLWRPDRDGRNKLLSMKLLLMMMMMMMTTMVMVETVARRLMIPNTSSRSYWSYRSYSLSPLPPIAQSNIIFPNLYYFFYCPNITTMSNISL